MIHLDKSLLCYSWPNIQLTFTQHVDVRQVIEIVTWNLIMPMMNPMLTKLSRMYNYLINYHWKQTATNRMESDTPVSSHDRVFLHLHYFQELLPRDSAVGIANSYRLDERGVGVRVPVGSRIVSAPRRPDRLWGPPNFLSSGYRRLFPCG
jgi:hypothetical protein